MWPVTLGVKSGPEGVDVLGTSFGLTTIAVAVEPTLTTLGFRVGATVVTLNFTGEGGFGVGREYICEFARCCS